MRFGVCIFAVMEKILALIKEIWQDKAARQEHIGQFQQLIWDGGLGVAK